MFLEDRLRKLSQDPSDSHSDPHRNILTDTMLAFQSLQDSTCPDHTLVETPILLDRTFLVDRGLILTMPPDNTGHSDRSTARQFQPDKKILQDMAQESLIRSRNTSMLDKGDNWSHQQLLLCLGKCPRGKELGSLSLLDRNAELDMGTMPPMTCLSLRTRILSRRVDRQSDLDQQWVDTCRSGMEQALIHEDSSILSDKLLCVLHCRCSLLDTVRSPTHSRLLPPLETDCQDISRAFHCPQDNSVRLDRDHCTTPCQMQMHFEYPQMQD